MTDKLPPIYFYIPQRNWNEGNMPQTPGEYCKASSLERQIFLKRRYLASKAKRVKEIMRSLINPGQRVAS
jgi:hypothetical protein